MLSISSTFPPNKWICNTQFNSLKLSVVSQLCSISLVSSYKHPWQGFMESTRFLPKYSRWNKYLILESILVLPCLCVCVSFSLWFEDEDLRQELRDRKWRLMLKLILVFTWMEMSSTCGHTQSSIWSIKLLYRIFSIMEHSVTFIFSMHIWAKYVIYIHWVINDVFLCKKLIPCHRTKLLHLKRYFLQNRSCHKLR